MQNQDKKKAASYNVGSFMSFFGIKLGTYHRNQSKVGHHSMSPGGAD